LINKIIKNIMFIMFILSKIADKEDPFLWRLSENALLPKLFVILKK